MTFKKIRLRRRYKILLFLFFILAILIIYMHNIEPNKLIINEYKISDRKLPLNFHGTKLVQISDIHYGSTIKTKQLTRIVNAINIIHPDIVVFTGDLIEEDITLTNKMTDILIKELKRIDATLGKYAIYGNHDKRFSSYPDILEKSNFILLDNSYTLVYNKDLEPIYIGGMNTNKKVDFSEMMSCFNDNSISNINYKIVLMHMPDFTDDLLASYDVNLILAGHSHNGQIRLPFIKPLLVPTGAKNYYAPHYKIGKTDLYVSSGLGTSIIGARLFDKPSFNLFRLTKSK